MTRPHPFDLVFGPVTDEWFPAIASEIGAGDARDLGRFGKLAAVETIMARMQAEPAAEQGDEYLRLLYAVYAFWRDGRHDLATTPDESSADSDPSITSAVYCALPHHRYWAQPVPDGPHEPIDGFFVVPGPRDRDEWLVLSVLGLRPDREGFSQVSALVSTADFRAARSSREKPFAPAMPGGSAAGFSSVTSVAEMLHLARLALVSGQR